MAMHDPYAWPLDFEALIFVPALAIFPEGRITNSGEIGDFKRGIKQILDANPVPLIPVALRGLWGSFFSRSHKGGAMRRIRGMFSRIALVASPAIPAADATPDALFARVSALRGEVR